MNALSIIWFGSAIVGALAVLVAVLVPGLRPRALMVAGVLFTIAGVLGIFSVGMLFVILAAVCFSRASSSERAGSVPPPPAWP